MAGAADGIALNLLAIADNVRSCIAGNMHAHMRAIGFQHDRPSALAPVNDQILPEITDRLWSLRNLCRVCDHEPAAWKIKFPQPIVFRGCHCPLLFQSRGLNECVGIGVAQHEAAIIAGHFERIVRNVRPACVNIDKGPDQGA